MRDFTQPDFWKKSHQLPLKIYQITKRFPKDELFGLSSQMRRSAVSIPSNIAEGCGRHSTVELKRFLVIAAGSTSELQYQVVLSKDLGYFDEPLFKELNDELVFIRKLIYRYSEKL